jgi:hypothetical protein
MKKAKKVFGILVAAVLTIAILWGTEVIPKGIGRHVATDYVQKNYEEMGLEFENIEFSTAYGDYIASFAGEDGTVYNYFSRGGFRSPWYMTA